MYVHVFPIALALPEHMAAHDLVSVTGAGHGGLLCCMRTSSLDYYVQWVEGTVVQAKCSERDGSAVICHQTCNTVNQAFLYDSGSSTGQLQIEHLRSSFGNY